MSAHYTSATSIGGSLLAEALKFDPMAASRLLRAWSHLPNTCQSQVLIEDVAHDLDIDRPLLRKILGALIATYVVKENEAGFLLQLGDRDAREMASFLEGYAYAKHVHKDANQIDITLSPPSRPSKLMALLPRRGFAWAGLDDTKDNLVDVARKATKQLTIVSPFIDESGLEWIELLFDMASSDVKKRLIVRARDQKVRSLLQRKFDHVLSQGVSVYSYAIPKASGTNVGLETFHAKIILADRDRAYIGSSNMNLASREISLECGVTLCGPCVRPVATLVETIITISERL